MTSGPRCSPSSRRRFLCRIGHASAGLALTGLSTAWVTGCAATLPRVVPRREGESLWIPRTALDGVLGVAVDHPDDPMPIYVHREDAEQYTAVLLRCTHQGCEVDPVPGRLVCPCHGSEFATDGALLAGPADRALAAYAVTIEGAELRIQPEQTVPAGADP